MTDGLKRTLLIALVAATAWFALVVVWAVRPQTDSVPVGIDYAAEPHVPVSQDVSCNGMFSSSSHRGALPTLKEQPKGSPPLDFQREPCELVQRDSRIVFGIDVVFYAAVIVGALLVLRRRNRAAAPAILSAG